VPHDAAASQVLQDFQRMMDKFLTTSRDVMLQYLSGQPTATVDDHATAAEKDHDHDPVAMADHDEGADQLTSTGEPLPVDDHDNDIGPVLPRLRRLLAERTGYPEELLDDDLDLEGDLGIDSIKRTEVVGALLRDLPGTDGRTAGSLRGVRTLSQLAEAMEASTASEPTAGPPRLVPEMVDLPTAVGTQQPTGPVLIIDRNSAGVAAATASALAEQQITAEIITATDPGTVGTGCTGARNRLGTPGGLLYLAGLDGKVDDRSDETTVLQCLAAALRTCGGSMTDGTFALAAVPDATPGAAAVAGFLITYAAERPDVRVRSIRFGRGLPNAATRRTAPKSITRIGWTILPAKAASWRGRRPGSVPFPTVATDSRSSRTRWCCSPAVAGASLPNSPRGSGGAAPHTWCWPGGRRSPRTRSSSRSRPT
jgi:hypothetical protein